jgi:hypothetical protein
MADQKIDRYIRSIPKLYKPQTNPIILALLKAWASSDDDIVANLNATKAQLFVKTAEGQFLDRLGSGLGVSRPASLGMLDSDFQKLIPNLSLKPKQIRKAFYDTMDVFWGPLFSRANIYTSNFAPYNVSPGDTIAISIDGNAQQMVKALSGDISSPGAATAEEISNILSRIKGTTISIVTDQSTGFERVNIRTNTPGARGSVQVFASSMVGGTKLDLNLRINRVTDLSQRTVVYEIRNRELIIELPAIVPALKRTLKGSHHFHATSTIEPPVPPSNGIWQGSFLFSPTGVSYTATGKKAQLVDPILAGNIYTNLTVSDSSMIPNAPGVLIFDFGKPGEEQPVKYISVPNNNTILIDPAHVFQKTHLAGSFVNVLLPNLKPLIPRINGDDLAVYLTSPGDARSVVQQLLETLAAAGVVITFIILLPQYKYLFENPYQDTL